MVYIEALHPVLDLPFICSHSSASFGLHCIFHIPNYIDKSNYIERPAMTTETGTSGIRQRVPHRNHSNISQNPSGHSVISEDPFGHSVNSEDPSGHSDQPEVTTIGTSIPERTEENEVNDPRWDGESTIAHAGGNWAPSEEKILIVKLLSDEEVERQLKRVEWENEEERKAKAKKEAWEQDRNLKDQEALKKWREEYFK